MKVKVTIATEDGEVLDQFTVANPQDFYRKDHNELAHDVRAQIAESFTLDVED